jgi:GAF domain-containing protein
VAVSSGTTVVVDDVTADPRYLTTFGSTRSEIVVPVVRETVRGLIDVESERPHAFGDADRTFLERCASTIVGLWQG